MSGKEPLSQRLMEAFQHRRLCSEDSEHPGVERSAAGLPDSTACARSKQTGAHALLKEVLADCRLVDRPTVRIIRFSSPGQKRQLGWLQRRTTEWPREEIRSRV